MKSKIISPLVLCYRWHIQSNRRFL